MAQAATTGPVTVARPRRARWQYVVMLGLLVLIVWSYRDTGLSFGTLLGAEGRRQMALFVRQMFPPDLSPSLLRQIAWGALETLAISFLGTLLAVMLAAILLGGATRTVAASSAFSEAGAYSRWRRLQQMLRYGMARALLNLFRSVPELIWALLFILVVGLGPFAGVLALGVYTAGVLGRLFAVVFCLVD